MTPSFLRLLYPKFNDINFAMLILFAITSIPSAVILICPISKDFNGSFE